LSYGRDEEKYDSFFRSMQGLGDGILGSNFLVASILGILAKSSSKTAQHWGLNEHRRKKLILPRPRRLH